MALLSMLILTLSFMISALALKNKEFPEEFKFGAATSSYQVEGGWNSDGKGESIWDRLVHRNPSPIVDNVTGDITADSYHRWREDVAIAKEMGLHFYRFSISWPRILPSGFPNKINKAGVKYYSDLIDGLLAAGVEPVVTMYHWELPVAIQDLGGWTNPLIVKWFEDYARVLFSLYADRVKTWLTLNEAVTICDFKYNLGTYAPGIKETEMATFLCSKYVLLAHAKAYKIYDTQYRHKYFGRIAWTNLLVLILPLSPEDVEIAVQLNQLQIGRYSHPIFSDKGGWPPLVEKLMLEDGLKHGYNQSRLPAFTEEERNMIKGSADFFGFNYYTTYFVRRTKPGEEPSLFFWSTPKDFPAVIFNPPNAASTAVSFLPVYPEGMRKQMLWLREQYGDIEIFVGENGFSSVGRDLADYDRITYIQDHLEQILLSIKEDNIRVTGYTLWSLLDNFEWLSGFRIKFGIYDVDFHSLERTRTPRASAVYYRCVISANSLDTSCVPPASDTVGSTSSSEKGGLAKLTLVACFVQIKMFSKMLYIYF